MAEQLTVRERIERRAVALLESVEGVRGVQRFDTRGNDMGDGAGLIAAGGDRIENDAEGDVGLVAKTMQIDFLVLRCPRDQESRNNEAGNTSSEHNRMLGLIEQTVMADVNWFDEEEDYLVIDTDLVQTSQMPGVPEEPEETAYWVIASFDVTYRHPKNDPYTVC